MTIPQLSSLDFLRTGIVLVKAMNRDTAQIVVRVLSGEIDAYVEIIRLYHQDVWRVVASMLLNTERTEDLVVTGSMSVTACGLTGATDGAVAFFRDRFVL